MDLRNSTFPETLQNKCNKLQSRTRTDSYEEIRNKIIKSKSNPNPVKQNL